MTEEEKRLKALAFMAAEKARLASHSPLNADPSASLQRSARNRDVFSTLAQNGITWDDLKAVYSKAYDDGEATMLTFRMSFFYAGTALAYHEAFDAEPEATGAFVTALGDLMKEEGTREKIVQHCIDVTGVDTSSFDIISTRQPSTRKDREAVERMKQRGITPKDLDYERELGYQNGWHADFYLSACFAAVGLVLFNLHGMAAPEIEAFLARIQEIEDSEISANDIMRRAKEEAFVDVRGLVDMSK